MVETKVKAGGWLKNGFKILPVKFDMHTRVVRQLFYKANHMRDELNDTPSDRTIFVVNIPSYCTKNCLKSLFEQFGNVDRINFQSKEGSNDSFALTKCAEERGFQVAHIVYKEQSQLKAAMSADIREPLILSKPEAAMITGIRKWMNDYNASIPIVFAMQAKINEFMETYDKNKDEEIRKEKEEAGVPDADGWVKVTRHSKRPIVSRTSTKEHKTQMNENKKKSRKELQNFYSFQIRESKMEHIAQLRQKFQADKQRITMMKESRKFKPY